MTPLPEALTHPPDPEHRFGGLPLNTDYIDGRHARVARDIAYTSPSYGTSTVRTGFVFDWASVPWLFRRTIPQYGAKGQPYGIAALFHDWLYEHQAIAGKPIARATADAVFYEICEYIGVSRWRRWVMYRAIRLGGWLPWRRHAAEGDTQRRDEREGDKGMKAMNGWLTHGAVAGLAVVALSLGAGCASPTTGERHTPISAISHERAYDAARNAGWKRVEGRWLHYTALQQAGVLAAPAEADINTFISWQYQRRALAETLGKSDADIVAAYNPGGVRLAKVADGAIITLGAAGLTWGVGEMTDNSSRSSAHAQTININAAGGASGGEGNGGSVDINITQDRNDNRDERDYSGSTSSSQKLW